MKDQITQRLGRMACQAGRTIGLNRGMNEVGLLKDGQRKLAMRESLEEEGLGRSQGPITMLWTAIGGW